MTSMPKPPGRKMPGNSQFQMPLPLMQTTLNPDIFDQQIKTQGVRMIHSRPVPCPFVHDVNAPDHNPACNLCLNGFVYYDEREFVGLFAGNDFSKNFGMNGTFDIDNSTIIVPVHDNNGETMDVQYFDQILIPDFTVRFYQRVEHSQSGIDRCQFPVSVIDYIIDANGKTYAPGLDVIVDQGRLKWVSQNRPGFDPTINRGVIYSINYYTRPVYTVIGIPHHLRMVQTQTAAGAPNIQARFPQLCVVRKDFIPFDTTDKVGPPDRPEPRDGSF